MKTTLAAISMALALTTLASNAQDGSGTPPLPPDGSGPQGGPGGEHKRPLPPLIMVLDANGDGVIDATEIANASRALKKLDKNGDGKLTQEEIRPPHPPGGQGGGAGGHHQGGDRQSGNTQNPS